MGDLSISRDMSSAEISRRCDEAWRRAFADLSMRQTAHAGPSIPKLRSKLYLKKNLVPVIFEVLEDNRTERGTMRATTDGSWRRAFRFKTKGMIIEPESSEKLILAGIPRGTRNWINREQPHARLGWANNFTLEGDRTDEERALWELLYWTAAATDDVIDRARRPSPRKNTLLLSRSEVS